MRRTRGALGSARLSLLDLPSQRGVSSPKCLWWLLHHVTCGRTVSSSLCIVSPSHGTAADGGTVQPGQCVTLHLPKAADVSR